MLTPRRRPRCRGTPAARQPKPGAGRAGERQPEAGPRGPGSQGTYGRRRPGRVPRGGARHGVPPSVRRRVWPSERHRARCRVRGGTRHGRRDLRHRTGAAPPRAARHRADGRRQVAEEPHRIHVGPAPALATDTDVQAGVAARRRRGAQPDPARHAVAAPDRERAQRQVGDAPGAAAHAHGRAARPHVAREHDAPRARRAHRLARPDREVHPAVAAGGEGVARVVERACDRPLDRQLPARRRGRPRDDRRREEARREERAGDPDRVDPARNGLTRGAGTGHVVDARGAHPETALVSQDWYEEGAKS